MTAATSEKLALVLDDVGLTELAAKARADQYHDFLSDDALCALTLANDLANEIKRVRDPMMKARIEEIRERHLDGDFDASMEESDEWAKSKDGIAAFTALIKGK